MQLKCRNGQKLRLGAAQMRKWPEGNEMSGCDVEKAGDGGLWAEMAKMRSLSVEMVKKGGLRVETAKMAGKNVEMAKICG